MDELEKMAAIARGLFSALYAAPIEERKVAQIIPEQNGGLGVSTVQIPDISGWEYETAILDARGAHPVERYHTPAEAEAGHLRWVEGLCPKNACLERFIGRVPFQPEYYHGSCRPVPARTPAPGQAHRWS